MRRESCTVVALVGAGTAGPAAEPLLAELDSSANISVVRPPAPASGTAPPVDAVEAATVALRQAAHRSSPFAVVPADPLAAVAAQWRAMWDVSRAVPAGAVLFEDEAAHALAAWRARRFELPDYYLVVADTVPAIPARAAGSTTPGRAFPGNAALGDPGPGDNGTGDDSPDFYLGPLHAVRPHRVVVVGATAGLEQAAWIRDALRSLRHGPWWPSLDVLLDTTRRFFAGGLAEADSSLATGPR